MKWTFLKVYLSAIKHRVLYFHGFRLFTLKEEKKGLWMERKENYRKLN